MWHFTIVLHNVNIGENRVKDTCISLYLFFNCMWIYNDLKTKSLNTKKVDWTKMIISKNVWIRLAIHNIISHNPIYQSQRLVIMKLLAGNLSKCSKGDNIGIKRLRVCPNSFFRYRFWESDRLSGPQFPLLEDCKKGYWLGLVTKHWV